MIRCDFDNCEHHMECRCNHVLRCVQPAVSIGNVGQLACDLLISTLNACRVGFLYDDSTAPVVGSDPFDERCQHVSTAVEGLL